MNFILNRLKLLDCRRQPKARVCDWVDSITPSRIAAGKEIGSLPLMAQALDSFVGNQMAKRLVCECRAHRGRIAPIDPWRVRPNHQARGLAGASGLFFGPAPD